MSIKIEYIVCNNKGDELKRFDAKSEAEAYDSVICAAEDLCELLEPLQKELSLSEDQLFSISEHLAFKSDEVKLALKQIKKPRATSPETTPKNTEKEIIQEGEQQPTSKKKNSEKK